MMQRKLKLLALAFIAYLYFLGIAYAWTQTYHMTATTGSTTLAVYTNEFLTIPLTSSHDWGVIMNGDQKNIWIQNEGTVSVQVHLEITNMVLCTVTTNSNDFTLSPGLWQQVTLTIQTLGAEGTGISWDLAITTTP